MLKYDEPFSNFALNFKLRCYNKGQGVDAERVWATLLARAAAERAEHMWLVSGSIWTEHQVGRCRFTLCNPS